MCIECEPKENFSSFSLLDDTFRSLTMKKEST